MIAINIPMPKSCRDCKLNYINEIEGVWMCSPLDTDLIHIQVSSDDGKVYNYRPAFCPLIDLTQYEDDLK